MEPVAPCASLRVVCNRLSFLRNPGFRLLLNPVKMYLEMFLIRTSSSPDKYVHSCDQRVFHEGLIRYLKSTYPYIIGKMFQLLVVLVLGYKLDSVYIEKGDRQTQDGESFSVI